MYPYPYLPLQTPERSSVATEAFNKPACSHLFSGTSPNLERSRRGAQGQISRNLGDTTSEVPGSIDGMVGLGPLWAESLQQANLGQGFAFHKD